jgi:hypothetical protein
VRYSFVTFSPLVLRSAKYTNDDDMDTVATLINQAQVA